MIDETVIRHKSFNMLKIFWWTELIATDTNAHKRIHTNTTNDAPRLYTNENEFRCSKFNSQVDIGGYSSMCEEAFKLSFLLLRAL